MDKNANWFDRLNEKIARESLRSAEDSLQNKAALQFIDGTCKETAFMQEDRSIALKYWAYKDGAISDGWEVLKETDNSYDEVCDRHNLKNPGDDNTIIARWINGQWVQIDDEGKARSA